MPGNFILVISSVLFPAALLSFTLLLHDFLQRRGMDWEKVRQAGILSGNFWELWCTKGEGSFGLQFWTMDRNCRPKSYIHLAPPPSAHLRLFWQKKQFWPGKLLRKRNHRTSTRETPLNSPQYTIWHNFWFECRDDGNILITQERSDASQAKIAPGLLTPWRRDVPFLLANPCDVNKIWVCFGPHCWLYTIHCIRPIGLIRAVTMAATLPDNSVWTQTSMRGLSFLPALHPILDLVLQSRPWLGQISPRVIDLLQTTLQLNSTRRRLT